MGPSSQTEAGDVPPRDRRQHDFGGPDQRSPAQRDRDRVLYCSALRRLAGVTQVVGAVEGHTFHNRLTHTLEAAQIARRLAEMFLDKKRDPVTGELAERLEIDADVTEAAALIHDLGHPPFGHSGESELDRLARDVFGDEDGFEGNAQSFRIVTRLAAHRPFYKGLNLTRATLNASLKYPWFRDPADPLRKGKKYSVYKSDRESFDWVRKEGSVSDQKTVEAQIMDLADDIAYSVHDLEDFIRAGLIPFERLYEEKSFKEFMDSWENWARTESRDPSLADLIVKYHGIVQEWMANTFPPGRGDGSFLERAVLKERTATIIGEFVSNVRLEEPNAEGRAVAVSTESRVLMKFCQRLVWHYVISNSRLASLQHGQRHVIRHLVHTYRKAIAEHVKEPRKQAPLIPPRFLNELGGLHGSDRDGITRLAIDIVASLTDNQAVMLHRRFAGVEQRGSVTDILHS